MRHRIDGSLASNSRGEGLRNTGVPLRHCIDGSDTSRTGTWTTDRLHIVLVGHRNRTMILTRVMLTRHGGDVPRCMKTKHTGTVCVNRRLHGIRYDAEELLKVGSPALRLVTFARSPYISQKMWACQTSCTVSLQYLFAWPLSVPVFSPDVR